MFFNLGSNSAYFCLLIKKTKKEENSTLTACLSKLLQLYYERK